MDCSCGKKAVINLLHGPVCKSHFITYFEDKVFKTIKKYNLIARDDVLCVAASGGKDSLTVLYLTQKYLKEYNLPLSNLHALAIDEGIDNYREHTLVDLRFFCEKYTVPLTIVRAKDEFGYTLDEAVPTMKIKEGKKPCNVCGVWRRYLLNKYAKKMNATKVITGHNLDDEAQAIMMNTFKANTKLAAHLGPISGLEEHEAFVQRVKPLYFCSEKETKLYSILMKFQVEFAECPNAAEGLRAHVRDMLNDFEVQYPGTKQSIINSYLDILPLLKERAKQRAAEPLQECTICGEPANGKVCNACKIVEAMKNG